MSFTIAIAGKGGTGKTTLAAMLVRLLVGRKQGSVLAIDADPNNTLGEYLGVPAGQSIGDVLEKLSGREPPAGMSKERYIEYEVQTILQEASGFDLLTMGRPEGPGCYCYVNNVLRNVINRLTGSYDFVVIDNEAGMEHISRKTSAEVNALVIVSTPAPAALEAARRIDRLVSELKLKVGARMLVVNDCTADSDAGKYAGPGLELAASVPHDEQLRSLSMKGAPIEVDPASKAGQAAADLLDTILKVKG